MFSIYLGGKKRDGRAMKMDSAIFLFWLQIL